MTAITQPMLLSEVVRFGNGKSIKPGGEGCYPVYGSNGIIGGCNEFRYKNGVIIGRVGAYCGSVIYCPDKFWASDNTLVAFPASDQIDTKFLFYLLTDANLSRYAGGAAQPLVTQTVLKQVKVSVPPLPVQQRIAGILSAYDELIENSQRRIRILEAMARALYREWFVNAPRVRSWPRKTLGDFITLKRGYDLPDRLRRPGSVPIVSSSGVTGSHDESKVTGPGLVTGRYGTLGEVHLVWDDFWPLNTSLYVVNFHDTPLFYAYWLLQDVLKEQSGSAAAVPGLNRNHLHQIVFPAPPREVMLSFDSVVAPMAAQARALQRQTRNLRRTRDLLLPRLLSGQINLKTD